jgi:peptidoglycan hydrolase-like protein with peptidoglycan-binding domain
LVTKGILLSLALCAGIWLASGAAATPAAAPSTTKKKTAKKVIHPAPAGAKTTARSTTSRSRAVAGKKTVRRAAAPPRQLAPTKERYQQIQQALAGKGYYTGEPNGAWGPDSMDALKRFQADQNLPPDGKLTSLSLIALGLGPKRLSAQSPPQPAHVDQQQ